MAFKNTAAQRIWLALNSNIYLLLITLLDALAGNLWAQADWAATGNLAGTYNATELTLTVTAAGALSVDGGAPAVGDVVLLPLQATGTQNGRYIVSVAGAGPVHPVLTRASDANASGCFDVGKRISVRKGTANAGHALVCTFAPPFVLDTTVPTFTDTASTDPMTVDTAQEITGAKTFDDATLLMFNAAKTFKATLHTLATAARSIALPDASGTVALLSLAQAWSAPQNFMNAGRAAINNAADTFASAFTSLATAARVVTLPDASFTIAQSGATPTGATSAPSATAAPAFTGAAPAFTGTAPVAAENFAAPLFSGVGQSSAGQVITTTDNQTMTLNQCTGMWFFSATHGPYMIAGNAAVVGAPAVLTIYGTAPTTDAGTYKIVAALPPVGTVAAVAGTIAAVPTATHTHAPGTLAQV